MNKFSYIDDPRLTKLLFAAMVKRLGGRVQITQSDIDAVSYNLLEEEGSDECVEYRLVERKIAS